jgi:hypothetical protein
MLMRRAWVAIATLAGIALVVGGVVWESSDRTPTLTYQDKDRTVRVVVGYTFQVSLDNLWQFKALPNDSILETVGTPRTTRSSGKCIPGEACGTVSQKFVARHPGSVTIIATRDYCGEAIECTSDSAYFAVTITVTDPG